MTTALARFRHEKDSFLETDPDSPFHGGTSGSPYYAESDVYTVSAVLTRSAGREVMMLATSSGDEQPYFRVGRATFELDVHACTPTLYQPTFETDSPRFFVPFQDKTSGSETYGARCYLEATLLSDGRVLLFNYAYSPFCAYLERFSCPLPPAENRLPVLIYAGEKL